MPAVPLRRNCRAKPNHRRP
ncbi:LOW QUALITY PROTEIN: hypothetical protein HID58_004771 [Brassica napus]|uniref:Uncharacterized protein n=1 Tax=Brassica napus TaxID=3708 RepID=A0ABQ8E6Q7_BRANA|nr:LOW QUALITY PROTEIN: hypothetical protein HID58_019540 [Brassica napus]KAH0937310.1 LOW QUALITY PROTEIN: hypothetical protein HID58_004771 [Brassica napus]